MSKAEYTFVSFFFGRTEEIKFEAYPTRLAYGLSPSIFIDIRFIAPQIFLNCSASFSMFFIKENKIQKKNIV